MRKLFFYLMFFVIIFQNLHSKDVWERVNVPNDSPVADLSFAPNGDIYSCYLGVFRSTDNGVSWIDGNDFVFKNIKMKLYQGLGPIRTVRVVNDSVVICCLGDGYTFVSKDKGANWEMIESKVQNIDCFICAGNRIFANTQIDLYYSDDNGYTWNDSKIWDKYEQNTNIPKIAKSPNGKIVTFYNGVWLVDPVTFDTIVYRQGLDSVNLTCFAFKGDTVFAGSYDKGIYISKDGCKSWSHLSNSPKVERLNSIAVNKNGCVITGSEDGGVYISKDFGKNWDSLKTDFSRLPVHNILLNNDAFYICSNGVYYTTDDGKSWNGFKKNPGYPVSLMQYSSKGIYYSLCQSSMFSSTDNCKSWQKVNTDEFDVSLTKSFEVLTDGKVFISTYYNNICYYSEDGKTWNSFAKMFKDSIINSIKIQRNGDIYIGRKYDSIYCSTDNGKNWKSLFPCNYLYDLYLGFNNEIIIYEYNAFLAYDKNGIFTDSIKCDLLKGNMAKNLILREKNIWLNSENGVFYSSDKGKTWINESDSIISQFKPLGIFFKDLQIFNSTLFVASSNGIYSSTDNGFKWFENDSGMLKSMVGRIRMLADQHIYLLTTTGVYRTVDEIVGVDENIIKLNDMQINVSPNPVTNHANIDINCGESVDLKLSLYDLSGNLINTLFDGATNKEMKIDFNAEKLNSGMYFLRAESKNCSKSMQISIVK